MFAPHCPTCGTRVLLGTRRILTFRSEHRRQELELLCYCGTTLAWDAEPPLPVPATSAPAADPCVVATGW